MNIVPFIIEIVAIALFIISYAIHSENSTNPLYKIYVRSFLIMGTFFLITSNIAKSSTEIEAWGWARTLPLTHLVFPAVVDSLLPLIKTSKPINRLYKNLFLYTPFLLLVLLDIFFPELTMDRPILTPYGWVYTNKTSSGIFVVYKVIYAAIIIATIISLVRIIQTNGTSQIKKFLIFFFVTFFLPISIFMVMTYAFKNGTLYYLPYVAFLGSLVTLFVPLFLKKFSVLDISLEIVTRDIMANLPGLLVVVDPACHIKDINEYALMLLKYHKKDLIGKSFDILLSGETKANLNFENITDTQVYKTEVRLFQKDGRIIPLLLSISVIKRGDSFKGFLLIGSDLSSVYQLTNEKKMQELRLIALQSQINPHFIFNSLNSIHYLISFKDELKANEYLSKLAGLIRKILDQTSRQFISIEEEIETVTLYIELESMRFGQDFHYSINQTGDRDELMMTEIPPMLLQPFIENAIWHGLLPKQGDKHLSIIFDCQDQACSIIIEDNGVGRNYKKTDDSLTSHISKGLENIRERITLYNDCYVNKKLSLSISDARFSDYHDPGTKITLELLNKT